MTMQDARAAAAQRLRAAGAGLARAARSANGSARVAARRGGAVVERLAARLGLGGRLKNRRASTILTVALAVAGPVLAILTYALLTNADESTRGSVWFQIVVVADLAYLIVLAALIGLQVARLAIARRTGAAGARLHGRMVAVFLGVAAIPTLLVALFFFLVVQLLLDALFSDQVGEVVRASRTSTAAYLGEHRRTLRTRAEAFAEQVDADMAAAGAEIGALVDPRDPRFQIYLEEASAGAPFSRIFVIDAAGEIAAQGVDSFAFDYTRPELERIAAALDGALDIAVVTPPQLVDGEPPRAELWALVRLEEMSEALLYVSQPVNGAVLGARRRIEDGVRFYEGFEQNRSGWITSFTLIYFGFAILVLAAAVYLGLWFAERLARPIGRLAAAAQRVRSGDLFVRVKEERGDDEIALLSRVFNRMTEEVKRKQDALTAANQESEERRAFSEAVVAGVSAGVVGLDPDGRVQVMNASAARLLDADPARDVGRPLVEVAPELSALFSDAVYDPARGGPKGVERPIRLTRDGEERELLARITLERAEPGPGEAVGAPHGFVVTLDDLTDLVSAQRLAAWGDVARRIAHEIKNPLTPIQLSAERLKRKYRDRLGEEGEALERYTDTIVRQTSDIRRMVDAFVRFAKLPTPTMAVEELGSVVREAVLLQSEARVGITYAVEIDETERLRVRADRGQLLQALTNLLQNASDAIDGRLEADAAAGVEGPQPEIRISVVREGPAGPNGEGFASVTVDDNGVGLPSTHRRRLLEPYVTTREKGTGLGLAIVSKIFEEHRATFELTDAPAFEPDARPGARAKVTLATVAADAAAPARAAETTS